MSIRFRIALVVTTILVAISVSFRLWLMWLWQTHDGGAFVVFYFWALITFFVTIPSSLITLGMWIARKIGTSADDQSLRF